MLRLSTAILAILTLSVVPLTRCETVSAIIGTPGKVYRHALGPGERIEINYPDLKDVREPYRVVVSSQNANRRYPVLVVVRQERSVTSWQLPLLVETSHPEADDNFVEYLRTERTLCSVPEVMLGSRNAFGTTLEIPVKTNFTISLSTFSPRNVTFTVTADTVQDYYIATDKNYTTTFSPSEPVYYLYDFPDDEDIATVHLQITSQDNVCFTASVQPYNCPIYDLLDQITYKGKYQTVSMNGGLTIYRKDFLATGNKATFVIVFVAHSDNYECDVDALVPFTPKVRFRVNQRETKIQFMVKSPRKGQEYDIAVFSLLGFNLVLCAAIALLTYLFYRFGSYYKNRKDATDSLDHEAFNMRDESPTPEIINSAEPKLSDFLHQKQRNRRVALNYFWHITNIAIFYGLPVVQLMVFYQRAVNFSGDLDLCYYNNQCSHPLYFNDFNHVYSNLGYMMCGFLFLGVTAFRNYYAHNPSGCGIPKLHGLYYAMGVALVFEGVLSACYHICPNQSNFQFDTSFMYVMAMLIISKLYQNRHPDVQASAYSTFTVLGLSVTVAMFGIIYNSLPVLIIFFISYVIFCVYMAFKIYFFSHVAEGVRVLYDGVKGDTGLKNALRPRRQKLFVFVVIGLIVNFIMAISGFFLYPDQVDFGTYLLVILMGNAIMYSIYYMTMKLVCGERICFEASLYGVLAIILWGGGSYFFFNSATLWSQTPAQSRLLNKDCMMLEFYDTHDIWHILSAPALFFSFAFLEALDDDLVNTKQTEIPVF